MVRALLVLAHGNDEDRAERPVNDRRAGDANFGRDLAAAVIVARCFAGFEDRELPQHGAGVGVEGVDAVVLAYNVKDVVRNAIDGEL